MGRTTEKIIVKNFALFSFCWEGQVRYLPL